MPLPTQTQQKSENSPLHIIGKMDGNFQTTMDLRILQVRLNQVQKIVICLCLIRFSTNIRIHQLPLKQNNWRGGHQKNLNICLEKSEIDNFDKNISRSNPKPRKEVESGAKNADIPQMNKRNINWDNKPEQKQGIHKFSEVKDSEPTR